jgi:hypothetical protein
MQAAEILLYSLIGIFFVLIGIKMMVLKGSPEEESPKQPTSSDSFLGTLESPEKIKVVRHLKTESPTPKIETKKKPAKKSTKEKMISKEGDKGNDLLLS